MQLFINLSPHPHTQSTPQKEPLLPRPQPTAQREPLLPRPTTPVKTVINEPKDISALSKDFVNFLKQTPNNELPLRLVLYSHFSDTSFPQLVIIICKGGENKASTILDNTARLLSTTPYCTCLE